MQAWNNQNRVLYGLHSKGLRVEGLGVRVLGFRLIPRRVHRYYYCGNRPNATITIA